MRGSTPVYEAEHEEGVADRMAATVSSLQRKGMGRVWAACAAQPRAVIGIAILTIIMIATVLGPFILPHSSTEQHGGLALEPPNGAFWLGTDELGRDILVRVLEGGRTSLQIGILAVLIGTVFGVAVGLPSGYVGGWGDSLVMRASDIVLAFPTLLLGIAIAAIRGPGIANVALAIAVVNVPIFARLARAGALSIRAETFIDASVVAGARSRYVLVRHVLPHALGPILIQVGIAMAEAMIIEAGLSFLGLGVQPPDPSWGSMLNTAQGFIREAPWYALAPGVLLSLTLLGLNLLIDGAREILDPRETAE